MHAASSTPPPLSHPAPSLTYPTLAGQTMILQYTFSDPCGIKMDFFFVSSLGKSNVEMIPVLHHALLMDDNFDRWEDLFLIHVLCTTHWEDNQPVYGYHPYGRSHYRQIYGTDESPWLQERRLTLNTPLSDFRRYSQHLRSRQPACGGPTPSLSPALPLRA